MIHEEKENVHFQNYRDIVSICLCLFFDCMKNKRNQKYVKCKC